ncbi:MAG: hypothetical protein J3R72DRAFT_184222 [Linnemannia gamsii]|nr:MAG: hypothetical protein J3R72DRAFT_184222 [Linnemannia gamsii]
MGLAAQEGQTVRLHELMVGPGIFHILVFTSDLLLPASCRNERSGSPPPPSTIKGVETTDASGLIKSIEEHLSAWRSKWAYKTRTQIVESTASTVPGPTTPETTSTLSPTLSSDTSSMASSLAAIPYSLRADKAFMVHTIASDCSISSAKNSDSMVSTNAGTDRLADNKPGEGKIYLDHQGVVHQKYGVAGKHGPGTIVVVRPDSYIGYRVLGAGPSAWEEVDGYLESILA